MTLRQPSWGQTLPGLGLHPGFSPETQRVIPIPADLLISVPLLVSSAHLSSGGLHAPVPSHAKTRPPTNPFRPFSTSYACAEALSRISSAPLMRFLCPRFSHRQLVAGLHILALSMSPAGQTLLHCPASTLSKTRLLSRADVRLIGNGKDVYGNLRYCLALSKNRESSKIVL